MSFAAIAPQIRDEIWPQVGAGPALASRLRATHRVGHWSALCERASSLGLHRDYVLAWCALDRGERDEALKHLARSARTATASQRPDLEQALRSDLPRFVAPHLSAEAARVWIAHNVNLPDKQVWYAIAAIYLRARQYIDARRAYELLESWDPAPAPETHCHRELDRARLALVTLGSDAAAVHVRKARALGSATACHARIAAVSCRVAIYQAAGRPTESDFVARSGCREYLSRHQEAMPKMQLVMAALSWPYDDMNELALREVVRLANESGQRGAEARELVELAAENLIAQSTCDRARLDDIVAVLAPVDETLLSERLVRVRRGDLAACHEVRALLGWEPPPGT